MAANLDIVVTWPRTKALQDYLNDLVAAELQGQQINYRVPALPSFDSAALRERPARCYRVWWGKVRGYVEILSVCHRGEGEVQRTDGDGHWPPGKYIVCSPVWHPVEPKLMRGFRGWHWYDYEGHSGEWR